MNTSIIKRAVDKKKLKLRVVNIRDFARGKHKTCDDRPFGGGPGMVMKAEPVFNAIKSVTGKVNDSKKAVVLLTPQGKVLNQVEVKKLTKYDHLILICGHYEGIDERIKKYIDLEISVGDYVLSGGETPALIIVDAITRLLPGVLHNKESIETESFNNNLLDWPNYTRPRVWHSIRVPKVLLSGNHKKISDWRQYMAIYKTHTTRPELLNNVDKKKSDLLLKIKKKLKEV